MCFNEQRRCFQELLCRRILRQIFLEQSIIDVLTFILYEKVKVTVPRLQSRRRVLKYGLALGAATAVGTGAYTLLKRHIGKIEQEQSERKNLEEEGI